MPNYNYKKDGLETIIQEIESTGNIGTAHDVAHLCFRLLIETEAQLKINSALIDRVNQLEDIVDELGFELQKLYNKE